MAEENKGKMLYEWEASEFSQNTGWSIWIWLVLLAAAGWAVWAKQWIGLGTLVMVAVVVFLSKNMRPRTFHHQITDAGVMVGDKLYSYDKLKAFWVVLDGEARSLNLLPDRKWGLLLTLQLGDANVDKVREALLKFLPEEGSRGEDTVDKVGRIFRL